MALNLKPGIAQIKHKKLKWGIACTGIVVAGGSIPAFAVHWQKAKVCLPGDTYHFPSLSGAFWQRCMVSLVYVMVAVFACSPMSGSERRAQAAG